MVAACQLESVRKTYGDGAGVVNALEGVSLVIQPREFTVLAGPSGSGKTTLLNLIGCLDQPSAGSVFVDGQNTSGMSSRQLAALRADRIGFVFQSFNLVPVLTAAENVEMALHLSGKKWGDVRDRARAMLASVGLDGMHARYPNQLSGGQQQRVAIARALVKEPALVIADEPTANLDSHTGEEVLALVRRLNEEKGATFVCSTHDAMVMSRARRVVTLRDGHIVSDEERA